MGTYEWVITLISLVVGICGGVIGAYVGMKVGIVKLEINMEGVQKRLDSAHSLIAVHGDDLRTYDYELEDVMRKLELPRKKRQGWRFES